MVNTIWCFMMLASLLYGVLSGTPENMTQALSEGIQEAVVLVIKMTGGFMLWNGLFHIVSDSGLADLLGKRMKRILKRLFPGIKNENTLTLMTMNMTMNMLGLGNAATPMGLRAMEALGREQGGGDTAGDAMILFLVINSSSLQLVPSTVLTLRQATGSLDPGAIILPTLLATGVSSIAGILTCLILRKRRNF